MSWIKEPLRGSETLILDSAPVVFGFKKPEQLQNPGKLSLPDSTQRNFLLFCELTLAK